MNFSSKFNLFDVLRDLYIFLVNTNFEYLNFFAKDVKRFIN